MHYLMLGVLIDTDKIDMAWSHFQTFPLSIFDCLQYAENSGESLGTFILLDKKKKKKESVGMWRCSVQSHSEIFVK